MQITAQHQKAAGAIVELVASELGENRVIHPGTALISCARLAGSFLFRSFGFKLETIKPGTVCLSENANEKGPVLINILGWTLNNFGIAIDQSKMNHNVRAESNLNFLDSLSKLQAKAHVIMNEHKLGLEDMAYASAMATGFVIKECRNDLSPETAFGTAIYSFIEGSKTCPPAMEQGEKPKGLFNFWK